MVFHSFVAHESTQKARLKCSQNVFRKPPQVPIEIMLGDNLAKQRASSKVGATLSPSL